MPSDKRVLIIDPTDSTREVIARRLRAQGYSVEEAADAAAGANMALCTPPAAVVADLWMPGISGLQLCRLLRSEPATAEVAVVLCGETSEARNRYWAERAGANAYVQKRRTGELVRALDRAIAESATSDEEPFFFQLGGGTTDIRDRIARHLDAALFDSVIAAEVRSLSTCGSFERLFDLFAQFFSQVAEYRWMAISTTNPPYLAIHHSTGCADAAEAEARATLAIRRSLPVAVLRVEDEDANSAISDGLAVVRPIPFGKDIIGHVAFRPGSTLDEAEANTMVALVARELGGPLRMTALIEESQRQASTDTLTGLMNRRSFVAGLGAEIRRYERNGYPLTLALLDLDHFKQINDVRGHASGDRVLAALGKLLRSDVLRDSDLAARWGGEEFVVAFTSTPLSGAETAAERLRRTIEQMIVVDDAGARIPVTASIGLASLVQGEGGDHLVERADRMMYASKHAGRNRVSSDDGAPRPVAAASLVVESDAA